MTYKAEAPDKKSDSLGFRPKRFWGGTATMEVEGGFAVALDGRPVKTPRGNIMVLPNAALASLVEAEWAAVGEYVDYEAMPLTRLGFASVDRMDEVLDDTLAEVTRYSETDLLCYPSEYPAALQAREAAAWQPILAWADAALDLQFQQNQSIIHQPQPKETIRRIQSLIAKATAYEQAGIMLAIPLLGSVILALALWRGHLTGEAAYQSSRIGEDFQSETWGVDAEAAKRAAGMKAQAQSLAIWFHALAV
ncbi:ATP12 family chaperone protein [Asticcacaulis sp.]|uniref:ATP12 family chaperone protein n=1 Tax=Asticcacaulis sp. TaxID=1872648 RepID=UPI003F7B867B